MSTEELMKVRYKVIADYPKSKYKIGEIIECDDMVTEAMVGNPRYFLYPAIFKKLEWPEERKESDMPEYVKSKNHVFKVRHYEITNDAFFSTDDNTWIMFLSRTIPATQSEYENQPK